MEQTDAVEEAAFLVHSPHRIEVLRRLRDGPSTRPDLVEAAAVSRVTLGRSLGDGGPPRCGAHAVSTPPTSRSGT